MVLPALAPLGRGPTQLLVTRTTVVDGERWIEVLLPRRPNGIKGWIRADSTALSTTTARVVIDLSEHRLILYRANRVLLRAGIAIGKAGTPTPRGAKFAIAEVISTNNPRGFLGPIVMPLTGYSEALNEYAGGNGRVAVHGTSEPRLIGTAASHGCIRMSNANIRRMARVAKPGTPVSHPEVAPVLALPDPPLSDGVVTLRPFRIEDVDVVAAACNDPMVQLYTRVPTPCTAGRRARVRRRSRRPPLFEESLDLAITAADGDRLLGAIGLIVDRHDDARAEIGYWVAPDERNRGAAGRALALMSRWAVGPGRFARLDLQAAVANLASIRVAERCGFVREGTARGAWYRGPERTDMAIFSLLSGDLEGSAS